MRKEKVWKRQPEEAKSKLRKLRQANGYTVVELARKLGDVEPSSISRMERFEIQSVSIAIKIVELFGRQAITLEDILIKPEGFAADQAAG